jgi:AcrR family transcriptional regulator
VPPTRERVLDAAVDLLAEGGVRALTHLRVDDRAGLPRGSTSNHFRTRSALVSGVVDRILELEVPEVGRAFEPTSLDELVDGMCALYRRTTVTNRTLTAARLALFVEARHQPDLGEALSRGRAAMVEQIVPTLDRIGARDPEVAARTIASCFEGLILHDVARGDRSDPEPVLRLVVRGALA